MRNEDFEAIYQKYHRFSVRSARKIVKDRMTAEDISQDVFVHLYEVRDTLDLRSDKMVRSLIFTATVNKAKDYLKRPWKRLECFSLDALKDEEPYDEYLNPEIIAARTRDTEYRKRVLLELRKKNPVNYDILIKVAYFDISSDIVAEDYKLTRNNVNNRILRTRRWLKKELDKLRKRY